MISGSATSAGSPGRRSTGSRTPRSRRKNFGWPCFEGDWQDSNPQAQYTVAAPTECGAIPYEDVTAPVFSYFHTVTEGQCVPTQYLDNYGVLIAGSAVTGLAFYDGGDYPDSYDGGLFFGDYARGCMWFMGATNGIPDRTKVQHGDCHSHFVGGNLNGLDGGRHGTAGTFIAPDHSYPSHLELQLTATDADGLSTTVTRRLDPATVDIALARIRRAARSPPTTRPPQRRSSAPSSRARRRP